MSRVSKSFVFSAEVWRYDSASGWYFVTMPPQTAARLKKFAGGSSSAYGSIKVEARCLDVAWTTSVFPDKKSGSFLLPLKRAVRKSVDIDEGQRIRVSLRATREKGFLGS